MPETLPSPQRQLNDCWNRQGVWGEGDCPELEKHVHCRNCPVYSAAASQLLDATPPPGYLAEWTTHFRQPKEDHQRQTESAVLFRIAAEWLALPTDLFREVAELRPVHSLPHQRTKLVSGVVNIRGELLLCIALEELLGIDPPAVASKEQRLLIAGRLLVIGNGDERVVFPVDEVHGIQRYHRDELRERPTTMARTAGIHTRALLPWKDRTVGLLDAERLFETLNRNLA